MTRRIPARSLTPNLHASPLPKLPLLSLCLSLGLALSSQVGAVSATALNLRLSYGGAVLQGQLHGSKADALTGIWSSQGRARLLYCAPRCVTVTSLPVQTHLNLSSSTTYRVALGGTFRKGQRVQLTLRFRSGGLLNTSALVGR